MLAWALLSISFIPLARICKHLGDKPGHTKHAPSKSSFATAWGTSAIREGSEESQKGIRAQQLNKYNFFWDLVPQWHSNWNMIQACACHLALRSDFQLGFRVNAKPLLLVYSHYSWNIKDAFRTMPNTTGARKTTKLKWAEPSLESPVHGSATVDLNKCSTFWYMDPL